MPNNCEACCKAITSKQYLECSKCREFFHAVCVNITDFRKVSEASKIHWTCPACQSKEPKKGNANTPVRSSAAVEETNINNANVTLRQQNRKATPPVPPSGPAVTSDTESLGALASEIRLLRSDMCEVKDNLKKLMSSCTACSSRLDNFEANLINTDARIKALEDRELEKARLEQQVSQLQETVNSQAQASLRNDIEIQGVNELPNENTYHIILTAAAKIGVSLKNDDLDFASRVGPLRSRSKDHSPTSKAPRSRILVVRFLRQHKRDEFLKAAKARRNLTSADLEVAGPASKIFCNERLTKEKRELFRDARLRKSNAGYKYCWTRHGAILVRKREGGPAIAIRNHADLRRCFEEPIEVEPTSPLEHSPSTSADSLGVPGQSPVVQITNKDVS